MSAYDPVTILPPITPEKIKFLRDRWNIAKKQLPLVGSYSNDVGPNDDGFWEWFEAGPIKIDIADRNQEQAKALIEFIIGILNNAEELLLAAELTLPKK